MSGIIIDIIGYFYAESIDVNISIDLKTSSHSEMILHSVPFKLEGAFGRPDKVTHQSIFNF